VGLAVVAFPVSEIWWNHVERAGRPAGDEACGC
jgi:hypothetical protein